MKKQNTQRVNKIPNYDHIFNNEGAQGNKKSTPITKILAGKWPVVLVSLLLYVIQASPVLIIPLLTSEVINQVTLPTPDVHKIVVYAIIFVALLVQNVPTTMLRLKHLNNFLRNTSAGIKASVVRKLQHLSITYYKEMESGKLHSKFLRDTDNIDSYLRLIVATFLPTILELIFAIGISLYKSPLATLFFVAIIPIDVLLTRLFRNKLRNNNRMFRNETENMSAKLSQMLEMIQVTKAHGLEDVEIQNLEEKIEKLTNVGLEVDHTNSCFGSIVWAIPTFFEGVCLFFSVFMAIKGVPGFNAGTVVLFQALFGRINGYVQVLINSLPQISSGKEAIASVSEIMLSNDIEDNSGKNKVPKVRGDITFENVCYRYPDGNEDMLKNINLDIKQGQCIAFVGSSGSGKSTIMNLIIGFFKPTSGNLLIDGNSIADIDLSQYRHSISVVPQNSILFDGTIRENITYGLSHYTDEQLQKALDMANVTEFLQELPHGVDTKIGEQGGKLSGGQKQRITIARALIRDPSILILDEATSALDNISEYHVQKAIESSIKQRTTLIVAHRLSTIRNADKIVVMDNGQIVEYGTYDELMKLQGKFFQLKQMSDIANKSLE